MRPVMNIWRFPDELVMSLKEDLVGPGSVKDQPPTEIHVCKPLRESLRAVKRPNSSPLGPSIGAMAKDFGSKKAKAKLMWVKPLRFRSSGATDSHLRVLAQDS